MNYSSVFKAKVFDDQEKLNEFILKNEEILKIIKVEQNGDKRALFYEEKKKYGNYTDADYEDYGYGQGITVGDDARATDYAGWNEKMWKGIPFGERFGF